MKKPKQSHSKFSHCGNSVIASEQRIHCVIASEAKQSHQITVIAGIAVIASEAKQSHQIAVIAGIAVIASEAKRPKQSHQITVIKSPSLRGFEKAEAISRNSRIFVIASEAKQSHLLSLIIKTFY